MLRFTRTLNLIGEEKFKRISNAHITLVGLGAVGSYAAEGLVRIGISKFHLIDFDRVELSNINRQLYALESTLNHAKTEVAKARILDINPAAEVCIDSVFVHSDNLPDLIRKETDLVVDAIDSLSSKIALLKYCYSSEIAVVSSMGAALRKDPSKIQTGDLMQTRHCPLARRVRQALRKQGVQEGISCVYSTEEISSRPTEKVLGSLSTLTGIFGLRLAHLAVEKILGEKP